MTRLQYIAGLTFITWGLILITPLYLDFRFGDAFVVIPVICLFILTGVTIMKGKKYSWTLGIVLGLILLLHFVISMFNEIFKVTDMVGRFTAPEIILLVIWTILTLMTLYSVLRFLGKGVRTKMNVDSSQYHWTLIASSVMGVILTIFLLNAWSWI